MKLKKQLLFCILPALTTVSLLGCSKTPPKKDSTPEEEKEDKPLEIGDTVKEWCSKSELESSPLAFPSGVTGSGEIVNNFGHSNNSSLYFEVEGNSNSYVGSDALQEVYFNENDAKNGDIISAYLYVPSNSNISTLQLEVYPSSMDNPLKSDLITVSEETEEKWIRVVVSYDTLETLGAIRVAYTKEDSSSKAKFYVDDINITLGEETVKTDYEFNDESLYQTYSDYFKVGACMSANMLRNTELRKIAKDNFNSMTAENEGKPEQILDKAACQAAAQTDPTNVVITTAPFEKLYDWCEANHIGVRHHTFVWYSQTPAWFFNEGYQDNGAKVKKEVMLVRMENFIKNTLETINDRWPGLIYAIDVANEAIENNTLRTNNNNWYTVVGEEFVYYAFKYAKMYKEDYQELYYNDYSFDYNSRDCEYALNTLLKRTISEGLIDGVGIQGHIDSDQNMENVITDARLIKEKGLKCQLTELDITVSGTDEAAFNKQKEAYKLLTKKILQANIAGETEINAFVVWGINDDASWKSYQNPLLFTSTYAKKPAYYGVLEAINEI